MEIRSIEISSFSGGGLHMDCEGQLHVKSLPCLSVVQAIDGSYDISLNDGPVASTGAGGIFIAPSEVMQHIVHHNGPSGKMRAKWAFLDVTLNRSYSLDDMFEFPLLMPANMCAASGESIETICSDVSLCEKYAAAYRLVGTLIEVAVPRHMPDETLMLIRSFVANNYAERIGAADIAEHIHCSVSQVFRYTRKYFKMSLANYINSVRLRQAAEFMENTELSIGEIADAVGFDDHSYFAKLFRITFGMSPGNYRRLSGAMSRSVGMSENDQTPKHNG